MADTQTQNTNETTQQNTTPNAQSPLLTGRKVIYINPMDLSVDENLIAAVEQTMLVHAENRDDMRKRQSADFLSCQGHKAGD